MEVGPLARMLIGYASGREDFKAVVDGALATLGVPATALFSTLGRTAARGLEKKGYVKHGTRGKAHVYSAAVQSKHVVKRSVRDFLDRLFGGDPIPLMQHLAEHEELGAEDIEKLKQLAGRE